jgi:hypothetical protein
MNKTWKAVLGVMLIYIFGCVSGGVSTSIFFHHKMIEFLRHPAVAMSAAEEKRLTWNLNLDANQKEQVHACFTDNLQQRKELQKQIQPQVLILNQQIVQKIIAILRPDQTELFRKNIEKFHKHWGETAFNSNTGNPSSPQAQPAPAATSTTNTGAGQPPTTH